MDFGFKIFEKKIKSLRVNTPIADKIDKNRRPPKPEIKNNSNHLSISIESCNCHIIAQTIEATKICKKILKRGTICK